jgi:hypothetical protein
MKMNIRKQMSMPRKGSNVRPIEWQKTYLKILNETIPFQMLMKYWSKYTVIFKTNNLV